MADLIPTEPTEIVTDLDKEKMLWYGQPGVGKSTAANQPRTLFLATEPGHSKMKCFKIDIGSWEKFGQVIKELQNEKHDFKRVVIDVVDILPVMCSQSKLHKLKIEHESDLQWGKGWSIVNKAFSSAIQMLSMLDMGIIFISHEKQQPVDTPTGEYKRSTPNLGNTPLEVVSGYVDHTMRFAIEPDTENVGAERRVIQVEQSQYYMSKSRGDRGISIFESNMDMSYAAIEKEYKKGVKKLLKGVE